MGAISDDLKALVALDTILIGAKYFSVIPASFFVGSKVCDSVCFDSFDRHE